MLLLLFSLLSSLPLTASSLAYDYSGCGNRDVGSADCLNRKERERIENLEKKAKKHVKRLVADAQRGALEKKKRNEVSIGGKGSSGGGGSRSGSQPVTDPPIQADADPAQAPASPPERGYERAVDLHEKAGETSLEKAKEAETLATESKYTAGYERQLAEALALSYDQLRAYVASRENSPDLALRSEAAAAYRQQASIPERFRDSSGAMGIQTNQDLGTRAPEMVELLRVDSEDQDREAKRYEVEAAQARQAAQQFAAFKNTSSGRIEGMNSIVPVASSNAFSAISSEQGTMAQGSRRGRSLNADSDITKSTSAELESGRASKLRGRKLASVDGSGLAAGKGSAKVESLREALRRKLMAEKEKNAKGKGQAGGEDQAEPPKSGFDGFFGKNSEPLIGGGSDSSDQPGFFLSGPETDRVVSGLLGTVGADGANAEAEFGDSSVNIFHRMSAYLRKCQEEEKVALR